MTRQEMFDAAVRGEPTTEAIASEQGGGWDMRETVARHEGRIWHVEWEPLAPSEWVKAPDAASAAQVIRDTFDEADYPGEPWQVTGLDEEAARKVPVYDLGHDVHQTLWDAFLAESRPAALLASEEW